MNSSVSKSAQGAAELRSEFHSARLVLRCLVEKKAGASTTPPVMVTLTSPRLARYGTMMSVRGC